MEESEDFPPVLPSDQRCSPPLHLNTSQPPHYFQYSSNDNHHPHRYFHYNAQNIYNSNDQFTSPQSFYSSNRSTSNNPSFQNTSAQSTNQTTNIQNWNSLSDQHAQEPAEYRHVSDKSYQSSSPSPYNLPSQHVVDPDTLRSLQYSNPENYMVPISKQSMIAAKPPEEGYRGNQTDIVNGSESYTRNQSDIADGNERYEGKHCDIVDSDDEVFTSADQEVRQVMSATIARTKVLKVPLQPELSASAIY